jgi:sucrose synthase
LWGCRCRPRAARAPTQTTPATIKKGRSGFHIDPYHGDKAAALMADFFERAAADPSYWRRVSDAGLARIRERYTWEIYANRLLTLSSVYRWGGA